MPPRGSPRQRAAKDFAPTPDNPHLQKLRERVASTTKEPGVYRWFDEGGTILYVGKAKNLRNRMSSYVLPSKQTSDGPWRRSFLKQIADFDVTVTNSELEALVLETNLIKELKPKYNVLMKDDKHYLYIRITLQDPFPRIDTVRRIFEDGAKYFGPYPSSDEVKRTLQMLRKLFPYRTCRMEIEPVEADSDQRTADSTNGEADRKPLIADRLRIEVVCHHKDRPTPCLDHHIQQCSAPCSGLRTPEDYRAESIDPVIEYLKGNKAHVKGIVEERMKTAALERKFEQAAQFRNMLSFLEDKKETQLASDTSGEDSDIIGVAIFSERAHVVILKRRNGRIVGETNYQLAGHAASIEDVLEQFLPQFYEDGVDLPPTIVLSAEPPGRETIEEWLALKRGTKVRLVIPERGNKSHLLQLAEKNAYEKAKLQEIKWETDKANTEAALEGLQRILGLAEPPRRIEGYDISHLDGNETVGSMVVTRNGKAANDQYRSFSIRTMKQGEIDDFRALKEVLKRRLRRFCEDLPEEERKWKEQSVTLGKTRKTEYLAIDEICASLPEELRAVPLEHREYLVARKDDTAIIGFARLFPRTETIIELSPVWVEREWRGGKLGQLLVRKLLRGIKKGKVYVIAEASLEQYYGELGFRYVIKPPKLLQERLDHERALHPADQDKLVLVWEASQNKIDASLSQKPDLLMIDGGKGQLSSVVEVLTDCALDIPVIGLAKREEEVFVPGQSDPIPFPKDSQAKFLLMRLRDEAHRFANRMREKRGNKKAFGSALDEIPGVGEKTKEALLKKFGTVEAIRNASEEELGEVLTEEQMEAVKKGLAQ